MTYQEKVIRSYVEKCFKDAFKSEEREYNEDFWDFEYILFKREKELQFTLYPITWCKYARVLRKVENRLRNNLQKNFDVKYYDIRESNLHLDIYYPPNTICPNFAKLMVKNKVDKIGSVTVIDNLNGISKGKVIPSGIYESLILQYYNIDIEELKSLYDNDIRRHLPSFQITESDWKAFNKLWENTFHKPIDDGYDFKLSSGLMLINNK